MEARRRPPPQELESSRKAATAREHGLKQGESQEEIPPTLSRPRELLFHPIGQRQLKLSRCGRLSNAVNEVSLLEHRSEQGKVEERAKDEEADRDPWWGIKKEQIT